MTEAPLDPVPAPLAAVRAELLALTEDDRLTLLIELGDGLPALPERYREQPGLLERVTECQSPVFIAVDLDETGRVAMHATAPREAPTTRGFAGLLVNGLTGLSREQALGVPVDYPRTLGLDRLVSPLRLAGMAGMLLRAQRQVRENGA